MKNGSVKKVRAPKSLSNKSAARGRAPSKGPPNLDPPEYRAVRAMTSFVRVLLLMGFDGSFISQEVLRATQSEKVRPLKRFETDVSGMARVMGRWASDPQFVSKQGRPIDLPERGGKISFQSLVNSELPGTDPIAFMNMLLSNRCIARSKDGVVRWRERVVLRTTGNEVAVVDSLRPLQGLLDTLAENMMSSAAGKGAPIIEYGVSGFQIGAADVSELCHQTKRHGTLLLEHLDEWLALRERRHKRDTSDGPVFRPYVGLFIARNGGA
jgi:hypothetical protein